MEEATATQPTREYALRSGLIFGAIIGAAQVLAGIINWLTAMFTSADLNHPRAPGSDVSTGSIIRGGVALLLLTAVLLAMLALTFVAGTITARKTGKIGSGAFAGLLAGILAALMGISASLVADFTLMAPYLTHQDQAAGLLISAAVRGLLLEAGSGAGMGALGGLVGARSYPKANPPATPYPSQASYPRTSTQPQPQEPQPQQQE